MINDKLVLLTIFLYITLSLRKVENFIQDGDTATVTTDEAPDGGDDNTKAKVPMERIVTASWCLLKLVILFGFIYKFYEKGYRTLLLIVNAFLMAGLILFIILAYMMDKPETWLTGVLVFETISNEYINLIMIYIIIKVSIDNIVPTGKTSIDEIVGSLQGALEGILNAEHQQKPGAVS